MSDNRKTWPERIWIQHGQDEVPNFDHAYASIEDMTWCHHSTENTDVEYVRADRIADLEREVKHWKANHDSVVAKNAILSQRPDLPVDRMPAIRKMEELERQLAERQPIAQQVEDARRWSLACSYEDNAGILYSAVINNAGDREAINAEFDAEAIDVAALQAGKEKEHGN